MPRNEFSSLYMLGENQRLNEANKSYNRRLPLNHREYIKEKPLQVSAEKQYIGEVETKRNGSARQCLMIHTKMAAEEYL